MNTLSLWQGALLESWSQVWSSFLMFLPSLLGAILVFAVGLLIAAWVKKLLVGFFRLVRFESLTKSSGVDGYLAKADINMSFGELLGSIARWLIILVFFLAVVDMLGLGAVSQVLSGVIGYLPNVLAAALIFAAGFIIAGFAEGLTAGALASVDHGVARPIAKLVRYVVILIAFFAALDQLQIARNLITTFFQGLTYTLVLVVGLSVGLGAKDLVAKVLNDWYEKIKK